MVDVNMNDSIKIGIGLAIGSVIVSVGLIILLSLMGLEMPAGIQSKIDPYMNKKWKE